MSINLAELGRVLCQEFDQRQLELNTLHTEVRKKVINEQKELVKLRNVDSDNQQIAKKQILEDASGLLDKYRADRKTMVQGLKAERVSQINEIKTWINERGEELKGWYEAGGYMSRKPKESKGGYKAEGHLLRKRTGR
ncbi:hypothetical protein [Desulfosporosinus nitroreducens]|uniref:hypothetical protein n=1 Tax=Desulfosporosinus nitroreducens TaxID=2018668 RepID=UPI00207C3114|nr:hypothetical protein [Desulfosporosinus nitroreducens]MCO1604097.1 hypothetical protein [Desulfosporosinus nitroreducens]